MEDEFAVRIIQYASEKELTILTATMEQAKYLEELSKELGVTIPAPVALDRELEELGRNNA